MKKLLALITLLAMVFLCACSPETVSDNREDDNSSEKKTVVKEKSEETSDEKDSEDDVEEIAEEPEAEEEFTDGLWKERYAEFLLNDMSEMNAGAMCYDEGYGRFALKDMTGDRIPELFVIDYAGTSILFKYDEAMDCVTAVLLEEGGTDVTYLNFFDIMFGKDGTFIEKWETSFKYWVVPENEGLDFVLAFTAWTYDGKYYCNDFDVERMCEEGFEYRMTVPDNEVTAEEYEACIEKYLYGEGEYESDINVYKITPEDVNSILG